MMANPKNNPKHDPGGRSKPKWPPDSKVKALFSRDELYRYILTETWDSKLPAIMFLMMNPYVAGLEFADPTLIKTGKYARSWGYGSHYIGNIHAYRITNSKLLYTVADPIGPLNDAAIMKMARRAEKVVLAYGQPHRIARDRADAVVSMLRDANINLCYLELAKNGIPKHPLYLSSNLELKMYNVLI